MAKEEKFEISGVVVEALAGTKFRVKLDNDMIVLCTIAGKMRRYYIKIVPGDVVKCEIGAYDLNRGRIVFRQK